MPDKLQRFDSALKALRPMRRVIITQYYQMKTSDKRSKVHIARKVAEELGYSIDQNGTSGFVLKVIRDFEKGLS